MMGLNAIRSTWIPALAALLMISASVGCSDEQSQCSINSDCAVGEVCVGGECLIECRETRDCPTRFVCNGGRCEQVFGGNCSDDGDCRNGEACINGVCQPSDGTMDTIPPDTIDTTAETDAPDTRPDMTEVDAPPEDMNIDMAVDAEMAMDVDTDMEMDVDMDTDMDMADDMTMMDMSCVPRNGQYGDMCECAAQCATGLCVGNPLTGQGECTQLCLNRTQCAGGTDACINVGGGQKVCAPDDSGVNCEVAGNANPSACVYQTCVVAAGDQASPGAFCSLFCAGASDCKPNQACSPVRCRDISGAQMLNQLECIFTIVPLLSTQKEQLLMAYPMDARVCTPIGAPNACIAAGSEASCNSAICCAAGDCSAGICTAQCLDPIDCPLGTCLALDTSDPRIPIGACVY